MPYTEDGYVEDYGVWVPGEDFDPYDPDEMEILTQVVWPQEHKDAMTRLQKENEQLRAENAALKGIEE